MKNIHILPTDKPSRLYEWGRKELKFTDHPITNKRIWCQNIYITSDEEIKEGDWCLNIPKNIIYKKDGLPMDIMWKKIILTTDQDLIKDGVQAIDDEFLEYYVGVPFGEIKEIKVLRCPIEGSYTLDIPEEIHPEQIWNAEKKEGIKKLIQKQKLIDMMEQDEQLGLYEEPKYPIGGYAPGNYMCNCSTCKTQFQGDKRAVQCEPCAIKMTKEESKLNCKDCSQSLQICTCIEDTIDMKQSTKDRILSETSEEIKQRVRDTANRLVMKQETLEEVIEKLFRHYPESSGYRKAALIGKEWQQERSYSEEEVNKMFDTLKRNSVDNVATIHNVDLFISSWKQEFKNK